jgi:hypothetical protein
MKKGFETNGISKIVMPGVDVLKLIYHPKINETDVSCIR